MPTVRRGDFILNEVEGDEDRRKLPRDIAANETTPRGGALPLTALRWTQCYVKMRFVAVGNNEAGVR